MLRGPSVDRPPGLLLILAAEYTANLRTPEPLLLAATLLLCAVPFMIIAAALAGRSVVSALADRLGLS